MRDLVRGFLWGVLLGLSVWVNFACHTVGDPYSGPAIEVPGAEGSGVVVLGSGPWTTVEWLA